MTELYKTKKDCCGCYTCGSVCPKQAITMNPDEDGFLYPEIDASLCIGCGLCHRVCAFQNNSVGAVEPLATYVAVNNDHNVLLNSASGGIFGALSSLVLARGGLVFGCAFNGNLEPEHICVDNPDEIKKLQGSKYVQSNIGTTYVETRKYLHEGRQVLFSGTPCQIAGLHSFLGKDYKNLLTTDLICHGVPSAAFFKGYLTCLEDELKGRIIDFKFRDKSKGWGYLAKAVYKKHGIVLEKSISPVISYYLNYFLKGYICRESCYSCKYAGGSRQGDFTMGDYWGIEKAHPEINSANGVSVLLVNSKKGMGLIKELSEYLTLASSMYEQARVENDQLRRPVPMSNDREIILKIWRKGGYRAVAAEYYRLNKKVIMRNRIAMMIPCSVKKMLKQINTGG